MLLPTKCPECGTKLKWTPTKVDLFCSNESCPARHGQSLTAFFKNLRVDNISTETVQDLINAGFTTIPKIIKNATSQKLLRLEGYQKTKADKVSKAVQNCLKGVPLSHVMHASGIFQDEMTSMGKIRLETIVAKLGTGTIERGHPNDIRYKLSSIEGIGPKFIVLFSEKLEAWRKFFAEIKDVYSAPSGPKTLKNQFVCFTGFRDPSAEQFIATHGGQVVSSVSKKCTVLFAASNTSGKAVKADAMNIPIVTQDKAWPWLRERTK